MGPRRDRRDYCYAESKPCTDWVQRYFKDCLCNLRDDVSLGFGLLSVSLWAFAEVPHIHYQFQGELQSRRFDSPPDDLDSRLYAVGSAIPSGQSLYCDHIVPWLKKKRTKEGWLSG